MLFIVENCTNQGRIGMSIIVENNAYIIEFKMGTGDGVAQIMDKSIMKNILNRVKKYI